MKKLLSKLSSLLKDGQDNNWSSTRFTLLFTVVISNISIFSVWIFVCLWQKQIITIPAEIITIYSLANGITLTGKVVQTRHELKCGQKTDDKSSD